MISIKPSEVPLFLHSSQYYQNLDLDQDDPFTIHVENAKLDTNINSMEDFRRLYNTLEFWGSDAILPEMLHYALYKAEHNSLMDMASTSRHHAKYLDAIRAARPGRFYFHVINAALQFGVVEVLMFLREEGHHCNQESVLYAIRSGSLPCLRFVLAEGATDPIVNRDGFWGESRKALFQPKLEDLTMIKFCIENGIMDVLTVDSCAIAASLGDLELLGQLRKLNCPWDPTICTKAARAGHLSCLMYLHNNGAPWDANTTAAAAEGQHMDCLTYAVENGCPDDGRVSVFAIQHDNIEMLIYAHEEPFPPLPWEDDMCMHAALRSSLRCLRYVHEAGCALTMETCAASAESSLECLQYAREHGAPWGPATILRAIKNFRMDIVDYALIHGCPMDLDACLVAIKRGSGLDFLPLAFKYNLPLHPEMCRIAAKYGYWRELHLLYWAGCPWTVTTTRDASRHGRLSILQFAGDRGCPVEYVPCSASVLPDHFGCMQYVFDKHDDTFDSIAAIIHDHFKCFKYAHDNGAPWSKQIVMCAAKLGRLQFLKYAFESGCPFYKYYKRAVRASAKNGHIGCCAYMVALCHLCLHVRNNRRCRFRRNDEGKVSTRISVRTWKRISKSTVRELCSAISNSTTSTTCEDCISYGCTECNCGYMWNGGFALESGKVVLSGVSDDGTKYKMQTSSGHAPAIFRERLGPNPAAYRSWVSSNYSKNEL